MNDSVVLASEKLRKFYDEGPQKIEVLKGIDISIHKGERLAIIGSSGSGKSTLLNLLGGLDTPSSGSIHLAGKTLSAMNENERGLLRNRYLGFVYQFHHLLGEFTALENVLMPLLISKLAKNEAKKRATDILDKVGLSHRLDHKPSELSGGERQRVAIARALVNKPACVLMDEPTGNLDLETADSIQDLMWELNKEFAISFVIVTHDRQLAARMDRIIELKGGLLHNDNAALTQEAERY